MAEFWRPAAAGVASVVAGIGVAELVSAFVVQNGSPVLTVGALIIDLAPAWLKEAVIGLFGTGDKAFLIVSLALVVIVGAGVAGWLERLRPPLGRVLIGAGGAVGVLAALTRSGSGVIDAVPSVLAAVVAILVLGWLIGMLRDTQPTRVAPRGRVSRRRFVGATAATAAAGAVALAVGQAVAGGFRAASAARAAIRLPAPARTAPPLPAGRRSTSPGSPRS